jgi:hypothetical protein
MTAAPAAPEKAVADIIAVARGQAGNPRLVPTVPGGGLTAE